MEDPYQTPKSLGKQSSNTETLTAMKHRHWVEQQKAKQPVIGAFMMTLLIVIFGAIIIYFISFLVTGLAIYIGSFALVGFVIWGINSAVIGTRLTRLFDRHEKELASFAKPMKITEVED